MSTGKHKQLCGFRGLKPRIAIIKTEKKLKSNRFFNEGLNSLRNFFVYKGLRANRIATFDLSYRNLVAIHKAIRSAQQDGKDHTDQIGETAWHNSLMSAGVGPRQVLPVTINPHLFFR